MPTTLSDTQRLELIVAAFELLYKAAFASAVIHQPLPHVRIVSMLNALVDHSCLPALGQQPRMRYAAVSIVAGIFRKLGGPSQSGRNQPVFCRLHSRILPSVPQPCRRFCKRSLRSCNNKQQKRGSLAACCSLEHNANGVLFRSTFLRLVSYH